jgi:thiosulfate dehydrogenase [quinone] large subunit
MNDLRGDFSWQWRWFGTHPLRGLGIILHLLLRILFGVFFIAAGINKINKGWLSGDVMQQIFYQRLTELHPASFAAAFLQKFAIPFDMPLAWLITIGELIIGVGLIFGIAVRWNALGAFVMMMGFAIGGYYDASLLPLIGMTLLFMSKPTGHWLGFDRRLYPMQPWLFK